MFGKKSLFVRIGSGETPPLYDSHYSVSWEKNVIGGKPLKEMAPQVGLEPTTLRLTAGCSAIELLRSVVKRARKRALPY
jgi:hypothetical protein